MLVDRYALEDVFALPPLAPAQTDSVLQALDRLLDDDQLYRQVREDLGSRHFFLCAVEAADIECSKGCEN
jgi:hypothetical protein